MGAGGGEFPNLSSKAQVLRRAEQGETQRQQLCVGLGGRGWSRPEVSPSPISGQLRNSRRILGPWHGPRDCCTPKAPWVGQWSSQQMPMWKEVWAWTLCEFPRQVCQHKKQWAGKLEGIPEPSTIREVRCDP